MKLHTLLPSLIFILAIQFASVHTQSITGTWSNPSTLSRGSTVCCIPDSMKIEKSFSGKMVATYVLPAIYMNQQCLTLFGSVTSATIDLTAMSSSNLYWGQKYSQMGLRYGSFYYEAVGSSTLRVYTSTYSSYDQCSFSYSTKTGGGSESNTGLNGLPVVVQVIICILIVIVLCFCGYAKRQLQESLSQNDVVAQPNLAFNSAPVYRPPTKTNVQFSNQAYVAPNNNNNHVFAHNANTFAPPQNAYAPSNNVYVAPGDAYIAHQQAVGGQEYAPPRMNGNQNNLYTPYTL